MHPVLKIAFGDNAISPLSGKSCPVHVLRKQSMLYLTSKSILMFFDCEGIFHQEFVPLGQMVNQHYYQEILQLLEGTSLPLISHLNSGASTLCIVNATVFGH
jgi:hypothetical protein